MSNYVYATNIVKKLVRAGYIAYFAGGWVRDYLLDHPSEDIDIATSAPPNVILDLFPHTILVGLSFGIVVVVEDGHQFEVATFRRDLEYINGRQPIGIELSTPEIDAARRDFTINGMFYDPLEDVIYDYIQGKQDLAHKMIRTIGDPYQRFDEDRLRIIRAIRFAARFEFVIDVDTQEAIRANANTLFPAVAMERIWQEFCKMSKYPRFDFALVEMHRLGVLPVIFPALEHVHLNEIKHRVSPIGHFPLNVETIWCLLELFPEINLAETSDLCAYLRISNAETNIARFFIHLREAVKEDYRGNFDKPVWAEIYAHPSIQLALQVLSLSQADPKEFLRIHSQRICDLTQHIRRIQTKTPLVNAMILQQHGVIPGKKMGLLLKEAERLAIIQDFTEIDALMEALKDSHVWRD